MQWYIDICKENGIEKNVPWMDDLFIDIVVLPSGKVFHLDTDELQEAYQQGSIDKQLYDLAWDEAKKVTKLINNGDFKLLDLANNHKRILEKKLN
ncbi:putative RNA-binding protein associated with RNAse of E/G family [Bacillus sp. V2I10]|nr:putative RNA-binding protein associated with RNAse of E/G family [Bacillus sp. V2I10]